MEAVERVSAEKVDTERVRKASYAELARADAGGVVDPRLFDLPFETTYRDDLPISWVDGYDIRTDRAAWVPLDVAISPACERVCAGVETNGLAAGNTYTEAVIHALHEVIERDAYSHACFRSLYEDPDRGDAVTVIEPESLPRPAAELLNRVQSGGVRATVRAVPHDIDVPVFRVTIADRSFPGREGRLTRFAGLGCDLDPMRAVTRAICEAAQSHTALFVGARDTFESGPRRPGLSTDRLISMLVSRPTVQPYPGTCADAFPDDLYQRLLLLLERLERAGLDRCIVVDLSRADLGIPVVRVLVPGASGPYGNTPRRPSLRLLRTLV
jgi:ribosomal protein S12 methylthiotransferase accessory factor